ncbi:MAG: glycosyltransferase family A protein [Parvularculaceae bacterium]
MRSSVCIFAHNEEKNLPRCIEALDGAAAGSDYVVHILENGSKDQTALVARAFSAADDRIHVHRLPIADKANAWNEYIHRIADPADFHIFIDADVVAWRGAFRAFSLAFEASKGALGAAGLPTSGRSRRQWTAKLFNERCLSGNLYALSSKALDLIRAREIRMPVGLIGEDGLLSYLLRTDLKGGREDTHRERIAIATGAFFEFESLGLNVRDLGVYRRRLRRYALRYFQDTILYSILKEEGLRSMPEYIEDIYTSANVERLAPRRELQNYFIDLQVLNELKAFVAADEAYAASGGDAPIEDAAVTS